MVSWRHDHLPSTQDAEQIIVESSCANSDANLEPTTIHSLSDDTLCLVLSHMGFASLLSLKLVSRRFCTFVRDTLTSSDVWFTARDLFKPTACSTPSTHEVAKPVSDPYMERLAADFLAALRADDTRTVEVLLHFGHFSTLQPVLSTTDPQTSLRQAFPLHFAHSAAMVALLCAYNAQVDARCGDGSTALMLAACAGEVAVVRALCEHGANVHLRNGGRPSSIAIHQAENCDLRTSFLRSTLPPDGTLWRFRPDRAEAVPRCLAPDGAACVRVLLRFGATRIL